MADIINFTPDALTVSAEGPASLEQTLEVTGYTDVDLVLVVLDITSAASVTVSMETSMQQGIGWVSLGAFTAVTTSNGAEKKRFTGVLRYLRWNVTSLTESAKVTFLLEGMIRL
ncbi:MAG: hypothetical protein KC766_08740 [Myxococcales bacterium]|nr:hypothetical protein [Myxococcales bacterium]